MKLSKLMLSAFVAVFAMTSCQKEETPQNESSLGTVEVSLKNVVFTKATTDKFLSEGEKVNLKDFKIFLTDGNEIIQAGSYGSTEPVYFYTTEGGQPLPDKATIHYVPARVNKVVVVGNVDAANFAENITTYAELKALQVEIAAEQDYTDLTLYGEANLTPAGDIHNHEDQKTYNLYSANVKLAPVVARFELDGFAMVFNAEPAKFDKVEVKQVALNKYYTKSTLSSATAADLVNRVETVTDVNAFDFFDNNLTVTGLDAWYYDALESGDVVLERSAATGDPLAAVDDMATKRAYHFFPGTEIPQLFIQLDVYATGQTVPAPSYIYSKNFKKSDGSEVTFQPGYVYRMNFKGSATNGDGDLPFEEDDINELDKCLEISVEVVEWSVVSVYPEF